MHEEHSTEMSDRACWDALRCAEMMQLAGRREVLADGWPPLVSSSSYAAALWERRKHGSLLL